MEGRVRPSAPPRFARSGPPLTPGQKRRRQEASLERLAGVPLSERIDQFTREGTSFPGPNYDPSVLGSFAQLSAGGASPLSHSVLGGSYWVLESELSRHYPGWKGSDWLEGMTLRPEERGKPFAGASKGWDVYYRRPSAKHGCDWIGFPRFFGLSHFGIPAKDNRVIGEDMQPEAGSSFTWGTNASGKEYSARPPQQVALDRVLPCLSRWGGTLIEMACGEGKSSLSTCIASILGRKTLIVVPTRGLIVQWKEALARHCPGATVGELREKYKPKKHDAACERDFVLTTSRSMSTVSYPKHLLHKFGTVIVDESHEIASRTLSQLLPRLPAKYVIGLTATPQRRDGLGYALGWLMGPCVFRYQRIPRLTLRTSAIEVRRVMFDGGPRRVVNARWSPDQIMWTDSLKLLAEAEDRNRMLVGVVSRMTLRDGRVLDPPAGRNRVAILTLFCDHARELGRVAVEEFGYPAEAVHVVVGEMPEKEQHEKLADPAMRLLVGTVQLLGKGFDDPRLDCIVLALPMGSRGDRLQQAVGRTERVLAGKARPIVIDPVDTFSPFFEMSMSRLRFYRGFGWEVIKQEYEEAEDHDRGLATGSGKKKARRQEGPR